MKNVGLKLFKYMLIHFEQSNYDVIINNYEMILEAHENDFGTKRTPRRAPSPAPLSPGAIPRPVQDPILPTQRLPMRTDCILSTQRYAARAALRADGTGIVRCLYKVNIIC